MKRHLLFQIQKLLQGKTIVEIAAVQQNKNCLRCGAARLFISLLFVMGILLAGTYETFAAIALRGAQPQVRLQTPH